MPAGMPRIAPTRKPHAVEPAAQPIAAQTAITARVVPIKTEPAPARLKLDRGAAGSMRGQHTKAPPDIVTAKIGVLRGKSPTLYERYFASVRRSAGPSATPS